MKNSSIDLGAIFERLGGIEPAVGTKFNPLNERDLKAIESAAGAKLPSGYRRFLAIYGAVAFSEPVYFRLNSPFPLAYSKNNRGIISELFGKLNPEFPKAKGIGVLHRFRLLRESLGDSLLPIGDNGGGDILCLRIRGKTSGSVYLWDHENRGGNRGGSEEDCYPVSSSFEEWIESLTNE